MSESVNRDGKTGMEASVSSEAGAGVNHGQGCGDCDGSKLPVPATAEFEAMCGRLPDDCVANGLDVGAGEIGCNRYGCRHCGPILYEAAVKAAFATAANNGLRYRLTVPADPGLRPDEQGLELRKCHEHLKEDAKTGGASKHSYVCAFGPGAQGSPSLELLTNVDFSRGVASGRRVSPELKARGRTCRKLQQDGRIAFREIGPESVRSEILSMVRGVIGLMSDGGKPPWNISSSLDIGISKRWHRMARRAGVKSKSKGELA